MGPFRIERGARCELAVMGESECRMGVISDIMHNIALNRTTIVFRPDKLHEPLDTASGPIFDNPQETEDAGFLGANRAESEQPANQRVAMPSEIFHEKRAEPSVMNAQLLMKHIVRLEQRMTEKEKLGQEIITLMDHLERSMKQDYVARAEVKKEVQEMRYEHAMKIRRLEENTTTLFAALSDCRVMLSEVKEILRELGKAKQNPLKRRASDKRKK
jgi:HAMP domain-containing protein